MTARNRIESLWATANAQGRTPTKIFCSPEFFRNLESEFVIVYRGTDTPSEGRLLYYKTAQVTPSDDLSGPWLDYEWKWDPDTIRGFLNRTVTSTRIANEQIAILVPHELYTALLKSTPPALRFVVAGVCQPNQTLLWVAPKQSGKTCPAHIPVLPDHKVAGITLVPRAAVTTEDDCCEG